MGLRLHCDKCGRDLTSGLLIFSYLADNGVTWGKYLAYIRAKTSERSGEGIEYWRSQFTEEQRVSIMAASELLLDGFWGETLCARCIRRGVLWQKFLFLARKWSRAARRVFFPFAA